MPFVPVLYTKSGCPNCFKVRLFLLEAGLNYAFELREFTPGDDREAAIRSELSQHFEKVTFPTVQFAPGRYMNESDDIIARYAAEEKIDGAELPLLRIFSDSILPKQRTLKRENDALRAQSQSNPGRNGGHERDG